jgi:hypothetical protein
VVIASHWPSRRHGRLESEPLRIAVAENIAFLVRDHVRVDSVTYEQLRAQNKLGPVKEKWETPVLLFGDFNDEPFDIAVVDHLQASSELDRVIGSTNEIKVSEGNSRLPGRRHLPLQRLLALPRPGEPRQLLHHLNPSRRSLPEPLPGTRPDHLHSWSVEGDGAAPRPDECRYPPHSHGRDCLWPAPTVRPQDPERHLRPPTRRRDPRLLIWG